MSRSGYSDDYEFGMLWMQAVDRATFGARGQRFMRRLLAALDAMPTKRLIINAIRNETGDVCALGAVDHHVTSYDAEDLAPHFGIARALAAEIVYRNDECGRRETPEERWTRMREWVRKQIGPDDEVDPAGGVPASPEL